MAEAEAGGDKAVGGKRRGDWTAPLVDAPTMAAKVRRIFVETNRTWNMTACLSYIRCNFMADATESYARSVLALLKSPYALDDKTENSVLQALCLCYSRRGWSIALIVAGAETVLLQVLEMCATKYAGEMKKRHKGQKVAPFPWEAAKAELAPLYSALDEHSQPVRYLLGYNLVPLYAVGEKLCNYAPLRSVDWTSCALGNMSVSTTLDAARNHKIISLQHAIATETKANCIVNHLLERVLHGGAAFSDLTLNAPNHSDLVDGSTASTRCVCDAQNE
jgi:hypothetical protein